MATGTGIYTPPEMLGDETADSTKFLRGDNKWAVPSTGIAPEELFNLLVYAFQRIMFLEAALDVVYSKKDLQIPNEFSLIEDKIQWK